MFYADDELLFIDVVKANEKMFFDSIYQWASMYQQNTGKQITPYDVPVKIDMGDKDTVKVVLNPDNPELSEIIPVNSDEIGSSELGIYIMVKRNSDSKPCNCGSGNQTITVNL